MNKKQNLILNLIGEKTSELLADLAEREDTIVQRIVPMGSLTHCYVESKNPHKLIYTHLNGRVVNYQFIR